MSLFLQLLLAFFVKHFFADYLFNPAYIPADKHIYGSKGSLCHVGVHIVFSLLCFAFFLPLWVVLSVSFIDGFLHYHIDYIKSRVIFSRKRVNRSFINKAMFIDQGLHITGYFILAYLIS